MLSGGLDAHLLSRVQAGSNKRVRLVPGERAPAPRPLRGIFVLDLAQTHAVEPLPPLRAFADITRNVYAARFIGKAGIPPWHFEQCAALTRCTAVYRFERRRGLQVLPEAVDLLEACL